MVVPSLSLDAIACVTYADDSGERYAPLSELYWASGALVSVHPASSSTEIETLFCPECFEVQSDADAIEHNGFCARCAKCPCCGTTLRPTRIDCDRWTYLCTYCNWSSEGIALVEDNPDHLGLTLAQWEHDEPRIEAFDTLLEYHSASKDKKKVNTTLLDALDDPRDEAFAITTAQRMQQRHRSDARSSRTLLPTRVPLTATLTRRSRREVAAMRAGIVYKPKALPLDGDSSSRRSASSAKKDASAIDIVPRVSIGAPPFFLENQIHFLLEIANPTTDTVHISLDTSKNTCTKPIFLSPPVLTRASYLLLDTSIDAFPVQTQLEPMDEDDDADIAAAWANALDTFSAHQPKTAGLIAAVKRLAWLHCVVPVPKEKETDFILLPLSLVVNDQPPLELVLAAPSPPVKDNDDQQEEGSDLACAYRAYL